MSKLEGMTKPERVTNERFSFVIPSSHNPVMLSEAKHLRLFSLGARRNEKDQRFFASLRMTVSKLFHRSTIRHLFELRHSSFVICLLLAFAAGIDTAFADKRNITEKDLWDVVWI